MKRALVLFILILMSLTTCLPAVAAETKNKNTTSLSASEALDQLEADMNKPDEISILASTPTQVNIGTNKTFTWANHGANISPVPGGCAVGWGYANEPGWADAGSSLVLIKGTKSCWSWVGQYIYVAGSSGQTRNARITFNGSYSGQLQTSFSDGNSYAAARVRVSVEDAVNGGDLGGNTVLDRSFDGLAPPISGNINHSVTLPLQAGKSYFLRFGVLSTAYVYWPSNSATAAFGDYYSSGEPNPKPGGNGITYNSISISWL